METRSEIWLSQHPLSGPVGSVARPVPLSARYGAPMVAKPLPPLSRAQIERFWALVDRSGGPEACWPWTGRIIESGYGRWWTTIDGRKRQFPAHRVAMQLDQGPTTLVTDHECHNRSSCDGGPSCPHRRCCNPAHLAAVPPEVNGSTGRSGINMASKTHCPAGHAYAEHGVTFPSRPNHRYCGACRPEQTRQAAARYASKVRAARPPKPPKIIPPPGPRLVAEAYREHQIRERARHGAVEVVLLG